MGGRRIIWFVLVATLIAAVLVSRWTRSNNIDFNTHIRPIINTHCIGCHGGVKADGDYSLLFESEAKGSTGSGKTGIVPGKPHQSEFYRRIISEDPDMRMPNEKDPLSPDQILTIKKWIKQGAKWDTHWSYKKIENPPVSKQVGDKKKENGIDFFVNRRHKDLGLVANDQAAIPVLARRLSFDLIGLPPPDSAYAALEKNPTANGLADYTEALLASPHYGEHLAATWMDLARYADTKGYERDAARTIWKYRDWLITAFNKDLPYSKFLIEQIAGDLLENPSDDQLIATAFHRNTMTNDEGGTDNEEFRVAAVFDRVNTTWEVIMGTTFSCVQCHSHPYDPFRLEEYYKFLAFFNNSRDEDTFSDYPVLRHFDSLRVSKLSEVQNWLTQNTSEKKKKEIIRFIKTWQPSYNSLSCDQFVNSELADTKWLVFRKNGSCRLKNVLLSGKTKLTVRFRNFTDKGHLKIFADKEQSDLIAEFRPAKKETGWTFDELDLYPVQGVRDLHFVYQDEGLKDSLANGLMIDWFYFSEEFPGEGKEGFEEVRKIYWDLATAETEVTPIMTENPSHMKRATYVFDRGNWLAPSEKVSSGVPESLPPLPDKESYDRLDLAIWLTDPNHPLTSRVLINRIWEQLFGRGIVETLEDLGSQGEEATHPMLLDHLAYKFMHELDWSIKDLLRYITSSATYRRSSITTDEQLRLDYQNRYYARGPRVRLKAEQVRDQALAVSALLNPEMYGPSVMPYQPEGIWNSPYNNNSWRPSKGKDQYRRAIYTYWKRTSPYPSMLIFDAMAREVCTSRRISTNTPLQALVTLNDFAFVEAANRFAQLMMKRGGHTLESKLRYGYKKMMYQDISDDKLSVLIDLYEQTAAEKYVLPASFELNEKNEKVDIKALQIVAGALFNLDEFIMKN